MFVSVCPTAADLLEEIGMAPKVAHLKAEDDARAFERFSLCESANGRNPLKHMGSTIRLCQF
jgi:hypothetical protein